MTVDKVDENARATPDAIEAAPTKSPPLQASAAPPGDDDGSIEPPPENLSRTRVDRKGEPSAQVAEIPKAPSRPPPRFSHKAEIYDVSNPAFALLQAPRQAMADFPADAQGNVDWVATLRAGLISPRARVGSVGEMEIRNDELLMKDTLEMPWVLFPHRAHTEWLACENCHPATFTPRLGDNEISMDSIMRGKHCGKCHDRVAFSIFACERCHSVVHPDSPRAWW